MSVSVGGAVLMCSTANAGVLGVRCVGIIKSPVRRTVIVAEVSSAIRKDLVLILRVVVPVVVQTSRVLLVVSCRRVIFRLR